MGKKVAVPKDYRGSVVIASASKAPAKALSSSYCEDDDSEEAEEELQTLKEIGTYDDIVMWGHESLAEGDDIFVKGLEEWIGFSRSVWTNTLWARKLI